jgi:hypothetical protein
MADTACVGRIELGMLGNGLAGAADGDGDGDGDGDDCEFERKEDSDRLSDNLAKSLGLMAMISTPLGVSRVVNTIASPPNAWVTCLRASVTLGATNF